MYYYDQKNEYIIEKYAMTPYGASSGRKKTKKTNHNKTGSIIPCFVLNQKPRLVKF